MKVAFKEQVGILKKNWLFLLIILLIVLLVPNLSGIYSNVAQGYPITGTESKIFAVAEDYSGSTGIPFDEGIAPDVDERVKTISAYLESEVRRGDFDDSVAVMKGFVDESKSILINENIYAVGEGLSKVKIGNFYIRVPSDSYEEVVEKLRGIGKVTSFSESADDVTSTFVNLEIEIKAEEQRLARYNLLFNSAVSIEDKLLLSDRIFEQERRIDYLKERMKNQGERVDYASLQFTLNEEESSLAGITVITIKEIIKSFIGSLSSLIKLIFVLVPYAVAVWLIWFLWKRFGKK